MLPQWDEGLYPLSPTTPRSYVETLTSQVTGFEGEGFGR